MPSSRVKPAIMSPVLEYPEDMNPFGDDEETEVGTLKIEAPKVGTPKIESPKFETMETPKVQTPGYYCNLILGLFLTASYTLLSVQEIALVIYMSFDKFFLAVESRDLYQADKSIITPLRNKLLCQLFRALR